MHTYAVVTTCNEHLWWQYAHRMLETFDEFWPSDIPLYLYAEGFEPQRATRAIVRKLPAWLDAFKQRHANDSAANGARGFRWDAVKFSHKVAAVTDAGLTVDTDFLIWMDADVITHAPVTHQWLASLYHWPAYIAWLDRLNNYPECGFYMLNCRHPAHPVIMREFAALYASDRVLEESETHDSYVLQQVIEWAVDLGWISTHSLSGDIGRTCSHPLVNSRLAECLDHLKGPRKGEGRSRATDLRTQRTEPYWRK